MLLYIMVVVKTEWTQTIRIAFITRPSKGIWPSTSERSQTASLVSQEQSLARKVQAYGKA